MIQAGVGGTKKITRTIKDANTFKVVLSLVCEKYVVCLDSLLAQQVVGSSVLFTFHNFKPQRTNKRCITRYMGTIFQWICGHAAYQK